MGCLKPMSMAAKHQGQLAELSARAPVRQRRLDV